jgi:hypothetical protein
VVVHAIICTSSVSISLYRNSDLSFLISLNKAIQVVSLMSL